MSTIPEIAVALAPILLQCAKDRQRITYGDAAEAVFQLGLVDKRPSAFYNIGNALGTLMEALHAQYGKKLPPLNSLVVRKKEGVPSDEAVGIRRYIKKHFQKECEYAELTWKERKELFNEQPIWPKVYNYPDWDNVLSEYYENQTGKSIPRNIPLKYDKDRNSAGNYGGGGEGPEHEALKKYVLKYPKHLKSLLKQYNYRARINNRPARIAEYQFPSLDKADVVYIDPKKPVVIEVKSSISDYHDLRRGIYQCVKYRALLESWIEARDIERDEELHWVPQGKSPSVTAVLVTESSLPERLQKVAKKLCVKHVVVKVPRSRSSGRKSTRRP
ncbi:MAG: hypothetical protein GDA49_12505 [Rhodospirillales bacterium]|nr:hypothetical protein [Rhodospirillales bacterium]